MKAELERTFGTWLDLARDEEVLVLLDLVREALRRRGYTVDCAVSQKIPRATGDLQPSD